MYPTVDGALIYHLCVKATLCAHSRKSVFKSDHSTAITHIVHLWHTLLFQSKYDKVISLESDISEVF